MEGGLIDERQQLSAGASSQMVLTLVILGLLGYMTYDLITTDSVPTWSIFVVLGICGLWALINLTLTGWEPPRTLFGRELPTEPETRGERMRSYWFSAVVDAAGFTVLVVAWLLFGGQETMAELLSFTGLTGIPLVAVVGVTDFVVSIPLFFALTAALGEARSRLVERRYATADD